MQQQTMRTAPRAIDQTNAAMSCKDGRPPVIHTHTHMSINHPVPVLPPRLPVCIHAGPDIGPITQASPSLAIRVADR